MPRLVFCLLLLSLTTVYAGSSVPQRAIDEELNQLASARQELERLKKAGAPATSWQRQRLADAYSEVMLTAAHLQDFPAARRVLQEALRQGLDGVELRLEAATIELIQGRWRDGEAHLARADVQMRAQLNGLRIEKDVSAWREGFGDYLEMRANWAQHQMDLALVRRAQQDALGWVDQSCQYGRLAQLHRIQALHDLFSVPEGDNPPPVTAIEVGTPEPSSAEELGSRLSNAQMLEIEQQVLQRQYTGLQQRLPVSAASPCGTQSRTVLYLASLRLRNGLSVLPPAAGKPVLGDVLYKRLWEMLSEDKPLTEAELQALVSGSTADARDQKCEARYLQGHYQRYVKADEAEALRLFRGVVEEGCLCSYELVLARSELELPVPQSPLVKH